MFGEPTIERVSGSGPVRRDLRSWVPSIFDAHFEDPDTGLVVGIRVVVTRGVPRVDDLHVARANLVNSASIGTLTLRQIKVPQLLREALRVAAQKIDAESDEIPGGFKVAGLPDVTVVGPSIASPGRGRPMTDDFLAQVAHVYLEARASGERLDTAVQQRLHGSGGSVGRWIRQAKDRGLIPDVNEPAPPKPPTTKGRRR